ncbi:MAG: 50S ribosomal protein L6 [Bdellovibrionales bacterium]|nr:50S ribosomal protein L6 [Bdellovibrionales bacterium]
MSRVGKLPISLDTAQADLSNKDFVSIKGAKTSLVVKRVDGVDVKLEDKKLVLNISKTDKKTKSLYGLQRALLQNAVHGVTKGFVKVLELNGVGYRAAVNGKKLDLSLGYSHPISYPIPEGIEIKVDKQTSISIMGASKELVGQVAAKIRGFRPPEPYLGKGVKYNTEVIKRKAGKSAGK